MIGSGLVFVLTHTYTYTYYIYIGSVFDEYGKDEHIRGREEIHMDRFCGEPEAGECSERQRAQ